MVGVTSIGSVCVPVSVVVEGVSCGPLSDWIRVWMFSGRLVLVLIERRSSVRCDRMASW